MLIEPANATFIAAMAALTDDITGRNFTLLPAEEMVAVVGVTQPTIAACVQVGWSSANHSLRINIVSPLIGRINAL